jgi:hypothetical protein
MTANPLKAVTEAFPYQSGLRAAEWARRARAQGLTAQAEAWEKADREGWDDTHYDPLKLERDIAAAKAKARK